MASLDVPAHDNSAMDGYAVRCADWKNAATAFDVNQRIAAGSTGDVLGAGCAARIFTGAPVPEGADAIVMQEDCVVDGSQLRLQTQPKLGQWIRRRGEDVLSGTAALRKGERIAPARLAWRPVSALISYLLRRACGWLCFLRVMNW